MSPSELADALGEPLGNISYHVRVLLELECVELVRIEPRRGALEHFYRAKLSSWIDDEQWSRLSADFRRTTLARTLADILEAAAHAARHDGFDGPEAHVSRVAITVDEAGSAEIAALVAETLDAAVQINAASAGRQEEQGPEAAPPITTELALIHLRQADTS